MAQRGTRMRAPEHTQPKEIAISVSSINLFVSPSTRTQGHIVSLVAIVAVVVVTVMVLARARGSSLPSGVLWRLIPSACWFGAHI